MFQSLCKTNTAIPLHVEKNVKVNNSSPQEIACGMYMQLLQTTVIEMTYCYCLLHMYSTCNV